MYLPHVWRTHDNAWMCRLMIPNGLDDVDDKCYRTQNISLRALRSFNYSQPRKRKTNHELMPATLLAKTDKSMGQRLLRHDCALPRAAMMRRCHYLTADPCIYGIFMSWRRFCSPATNMFRPRRNQTNIEKHTLLRACATHPGDNVPTE